MTTSGILTPGSVLVLGSGACTCSGVAGDAVREADSDWTLLGHAPEAMRRRVPIDAEERGEMWIVAIMLGERADIFASAFDIDPAVISYQVIR